MCVLAKDSATGMIKTELEDKNAQTEDTEYQQRTEVKSC